MSPQKASLVEAAPLEGPAWVSGAAPYGAEETRAPEDGSQVALACSGLVGSLSPNPLGSPKERVRGRQGGGRTLLMARKREVT